HGRKPRMRAFGHRASATRDRPCGRPAQPERPRRVLGGGRRSRFPTIGRLAMPKLTVMDWERVLLFIGGRFKRVLGPGVHRYPRGRCRLFPVDMRPDIVRVSGQEVITSDGVNIRVSVTARWRVEDPVAFTTGSRDPRD